MLFVDDSKHEIEHVQVYLPEVSTILFHPHKIYLSLSNFCLKDCTDIELILKLSQPILKSETGYSSGQKQ